MRSISVREMRAALPRLEQLLAEEGEVVITRNGRPVARVLPPRHVSRSRLMLNSEVACLVSTSEVKC